MAILKSCCFWQTVRRGSYASGIFTLIYFIISSITISLFIYIERRYENGERKVPEGLSFAGDTPITVIFNVMILTSSSIGAVVSILLLIGIHKNCRNLLLPWIFAMSADILIEASHFLYVLIFEEVEYKVYTIFLAIVDFFVTLINIYCLLCVMSCYQEFSKGRCLRKDSFATVNDANFIPSSATQTTVRPDVPPKSNPYKCDHINCTLGNVNHINSMKYVDEILPWSEQDYYENC